MDSFLQKFSLQNLLRQFFCGVVFFVPLWLFGRTAIVEILGVEKDNAGVYLIFVALASIIGTTIYHLEKNIYSYSVQCMFEMFSSVKDKFSWFPPIIVSLLLTLAFSPFVSVIVGFSPVKIFICYIFSIFSVLCVMCSVFSDNFKEVCTRTQKSWMIEDEQCVKISVTERYLTDAAIFRLLCAHAISKKVSTWSDFIHCVQSCCFAWIAGSCFVKLVLKADVDITLGNSIACSLLLFELIFDWHRYQHVIDMTEGSFTSPKYSK